MTLLSSVLGSPDTLPSPPPEATLSTPYLLFVGALLLAFALVKRLQRKLRPERRHPVQLIARRAVGPKQSVVLLETDGRRFLIGVAGERLDCLAQWCSPTTFAELLHSESAREPLSESDLSQEDRRTEPKNQAVG